LSTSNETSPKELHLLTANALLIELVAGRSVNKGDNELLKIDNPDSRAILNWYRQHPDKWTANLNATDTDAIIDLIGTTVFEVGQAGEANPEGSGKTLHLTKIEAHKFAGLHSYSLSENEPSNFVFEPSKSVTLFEGVNGSGKTSIANSLVWCLTGQLIRSQRPPEPGTNEFFCQISDDDGEVAESAMSAVTPLPSTSLDTASAIGNKLPADTWVELIFADDEGNVYPPVRREQRRKANGKLEENVTGLGSLPADPISLQVATVMPALLPYLAVGTTSELGTAIAKLTGLSSLVDLAKHAGKQSDRISKRKEADQLAQRFAESVTDLEAQISEYPEMEFAKEVPTIDAEDAAVCLKEMKSHFEKLKSDALEDANAELGGAFDAENKQARDDLEKSIQPAVAQLKRLRELPSVGRLSALEISNDETATIETILQELDTQAKTLAELQQNPDLARRKQLYARVAAWQLEHETAEDENCPVCTSVLAERKDPVTKRPISDHLNEAAEDHSLLSRTIEEWADYWQGKLANELPAPIAAEIRKDLLHDSPRSLMKQGLVSELFEVEALSSSLKPLKEDVSELFDERADMLGGYVQHQAPHLPQPLVIEETKPLRLMLERTSKALAFAKWRSANREQIRDFFSIIILGKDGDPDLARALGTRLARLLSIVEGVAPLNFAIELVKRLEVVLTHHVAKLKRIDACDKAKAALDEINSLGGLAQSQVDALREKLQDRSEHWRKSLFLNATKFAPDLVGTNMDAKGVIELSVGRLGVAAPAQHIYNASALRGALLGFFLAFREHVLEERGGLSAIVFDDPQELLDKDNRKRLARGLTLLADAKAQLFVTTHDSQFARALADKNRPSSRIDHFSVHPVNSVRSLSLAPSVEAVDEAKAAFEANENDNEAAANYAAKLRIFIEARLGDLFDTSAHPAFSSTTKLLTLIPLLDKLRGLVGTGANELFDNSIVKQFANDKAFDEGAEPRRILNDSHHQEKIVYGEVDAVADEFTRLRRAVEKVREQFAYHQLREPLVNPTVAINDNVVSLPQIAKPQFCVPVHPDLAAFSGHSPEGGTQDVAEDLLDGEWFEQRALYYIRGDTLGFAIPSGSIAIVDVEPYEGRDRNLVIGLKSQQVFARRLIKAHEGSSFSLSAQMPDPRAKRRSLTFEPRSVALHKIVGAIFSDMPPPIVGGNEATAVTAVPELTEIKCAFRVKDDSAIPLALPGQTILGGASIPATHLDDWSGKVVAVSASDGSQYLKRVGDRLPSPLAHLRQFETIGGLGSSVVLSGEVTDNALDIPAILSVRKVLGVLYDGI